MCSTAPPMHDFDIFSCLFQSYDIHELLILVFFEAIIKPTNWIIPNKKLKFTSQIHYFAALCKFPLFVYSKKVKYKKFDNEIGDK